jgi:hypothetical protein
LLEKRFGPLEPAVLAKFEQLPAERLQTIQDAVLDARSLEDLVGLKE